MHLVCSPASSVWVVNNLCKPGMLDAIEDAQLSSCPLDDTTKSSDPGGQLNLERSPQSSYGAL